MTCGLCGGDLELMGTLGAAKQYRCRACHAWSTHRDSTKKSREKAAASPSGRKSTESPALHNIPIHTEMGKEIRKAFVPSEYVFADVNFNGTEMRILEHMMEEAVAEEKGDLDACAIELLYAVKNHLHRQKDLGDPEPSPPPDDVIRLIKERSEAALRRALEVFNTECRFAHTSRALTRAIHTLKGSDRRQRKGG